MSRFCPNCGQPRPPSHADPLQDPPCPACGAPPPVRSSPPDPASPAESESHRAGRLQSRYRRTIAIAVAVLILLALLIGLLLQPSSSNSAARRVKNVVFGPRITEAVENGIQRRRASQEQGDSDDDRGDRDRPGSSLPANVQNPDQPGSNLDTPPERSIGWLDRFFGQSPDSPPPRAGLGGIGESPGSGNTNTPPTSASTEPTAAEITQPEPAPDLPRDLEPARPDPPRTTNRRVPPSDATLNDNLEKLLRQHRAGTGDLRISLMWSNRNDLDLHVVDPSGTEIYYQNRGSTTGGLLDIDMNAGPPLRSPAVENVFWPERGAPAGRFRVFVNHFRQHDPVDETPFTVRILIRGRTTDFRGSIRFGETKRLVHEFTLGP